MEREPRELSPPLIRHILWTHCWLSALVIFVTWGLWLCDVALGVDLFALMKGRDKERDSATIALGAAAIVTLVAGMIAAVRARKALPLARNGVEVLGTITGTGILRTHGLVSIKCTYRYAGEEHVYVCLSARGTRSVGDPIALIVDPDDPGGCVLAEDVLPESE